MLPLPQVELLSRVLEGRGKIRCFDNDGSAMVPPITPCHLISRVSIQGGSPVSVQGCTPERRLRKFCAIKRAPDCPIWCAMTVFPRARAIWMRHGEARSAS